MKHKVIKGAILVYTLIVLAAAVFLFMISDQSVILADTMSSSNKSTELIALPSGERNATINYGDTISVEKIFNLTEEQKKDINIATNKIDTKKIGTSYIVVTFEEDGQTSTGIIHLTVVNTEKPTLNFTNKTIYKGTTVDLLSDVTAEDKVDGDITSKIVTEGTVDTSVDGVYEVTYTVTDSTNNQTTATREITVEDDPNEVVQEKDASVADISEQVRSDTTTQPITTAPEKATTNNAQPANTLVINGKTIAYQNGGENDGQAIIDANPNENVSTWGGAAVQSGADNQNTHFIGHNPGAFSVLFSVNTGQSITVTDGNGVATTYVITAIVHTDDYGIEVGTTNDYWDQIVGTGGGERITLQTCISDTENLIVFASL